jgi:endonuclease YncB( thermonuclease family)
MAKSMESTHQNTFSPLRPVRILSTVLSFILLSSATLSAADQFQVIRVTDGDTIKVTNNGKTSVIRLVGIDAPETSKGKNKPGQPFSRKSTKHLAGLVLNKSVEIQSYGTDRYGRTLGVVYYNGTNVNLEMVKSGLAEVYRGKSSKGFDNGPYWKAEKDARGDGRGMWSLGDRYVSPREWRKIHK